jgi:serine protease Do
MKSNEASRTINTTRRPSTCRSVALLIGAVTFLLLPAIEASAQSLATSRYRNGTAIRKVFESVAAEPSRWTAVVESDGKQVALGVVVGAEGWILSKASELKGKLTVRTKEGPRSTATIVGIHKDYDLAMLKIEASELPTVAWRTGDDPAVGRWLVTPGLQDTPVSIGVVSVKRRRIGPQSGVLGISIADEEGGPKITQIFPNSGAAKAGLKVGDIVMKVAGKLVKDGATLSATIRAFRPGARLSLLIRRGMAEQQFDATLGHRFPGLPGRGAVQNRMGGQLSTRRTGFKYVLQHDTFLKPQECGGPIVDLDGRAIGINIARAGRTETYAVPVSEILPLLDDLKSGKLAPPALRISPPPPPALPEGP